MQHYNKLAKMSSSKDEASLPRASLLSQLFQLRCRVLSWSSGTSCNTPRRRAPKPGPGAPSMLHLKSNWQTRDCFSTAIATDSKAQAVMLRKEFIQKTAMVRSAPQWEWQREVQRKFSLWGCKKKRGRDTRSEP